jgi:alkaline phosphatase
VKNVILFIGDGMGPREVDLGKLMGDGALWTDAAPWTTGSVATASLDGVTDSAAAATALATGVETYNGWLAMAPPLPGTPVQTVLERAEPLKATGLITDADERAATPAAFAAHVTDRDLDLDITEQIAAKDIELLLSGGWSYDYLLEGRQGVTYVQNSSDLAYLAGQGAWPGHLYGFIGKSGLVYNLDREEEGVVGIQPMLPELTSAALGVLGQDPDGFFLMVEAAVIDYGGHSRDAAWIASEVKELDRAVQVAVDYARSRTDTLVIVTADHETGGLTFGSTIKTSVISRQSATVEFMWGEIAAGRKTIKQAMAAYAGITDLTRAEERTIASYKEMGIADVLSAREKVSWGWSGLDEGDHTLTNVPIWAWGPGQGAFAGQYANERVGSLLLNAISH